MASKSNEAVEIHSANISEVVIKSLFGLYDYKLESKTAVNSDFQLLILYGDNGSGKSTILKLLYHLLNPELYNGHRTYVASIPFDEIYVRLDTGFEVKANRKHSHDLASYVIEVYDPSSSKKDHRWTWKKDEKGIKSDVGYHIYCQSLLQQGLNLHFLQDSRKTERMGNDVEHQRRLSRIEHEQLIFNLEERNSNHQTLVEKAVIETLQWFQREALSGTNEGQNSANELYSSLIQSLISKKQDNQNTSTAKAATLTNSIEALIALERKNELYSRYDLTAELNTNSIRRHLKRAKPDKFELLNSVIEPYISGHTARLDALQDLQEIIETFVSLLSEFYKGKTISLKIGKTFNIVADSGHPIELEHLSSGEKHLLLLFCNAILARSNGTILIIDEPEISLNIKWQRKLVEALQSCMKGVKCQLIIATHSFEILAGHDSFVNKLENTSK